MMIKLAVPYDLLNDLMTFSLLKALESTFNKEKALGGAFSVIVKYSRIFV